MKGFYGLYVMAGMLLCCSFAGAENIAVSLVTPSAAYMDHFVAIEKGYFREQNLNVEYIRAGGGVATPALMSGELHLSTSAGSALSAGLRGGPLKIVYTNLSRPSYKFISTKPEIQTLKASSKRFTPNSRRAVGNRNPRGSAQNDLAARSVSPIYVRG
jgi:ABC-type nitrate/sulfonate/bicarbonate transport system substrate-binding protein